LLRLQIEYCVSAFSPNYDKDKELLQKVQRKFTRMFTGLKGKDYFMDIGGRRNKQNQIQVFKEYKVFTKLDISELFAKDSNE